MLASPARRATTPGMTSRSASPLSCWYFELHMTSRCGRIPEHEGFPLMFSIAVRSRMSAASERCARCRCSVTSTAMPISWISGRVRVDHLGAGAHPDPLARRRGVMRKTWSIWSISRATIRLASSNRSSSSSAWMISATSPKDSIVSQGSVAQHVVHRARPVHLAAHHVPVPQAAAAAHQSEVDALMRFEVDAVGRLRRAPPG